MDNEQINEEYLAQPVEPDDVRFQYCTTHPTVRYTEMFEHTYGCEICFFEQVNQ